jgi:hypothetical protein
MKFTTVSIKEIQADKTHRLDAKYWINKKKQKKNKSSSSQAGGPAPKESGFKPPSFPDSCNNLFDREVDK